MPVQVVGSSIGDDEPLMSAGLDSLGSVEFANVLAQKLGMQMPGTLVFDYPSVNAVTDYLTAQLIKAAAAAAPAGGSSAADAASQGELEEDASARALYPSGSLQQGELLAAASQRGSGHLAILAVVARPIVGSVSAAEAGQAGSIGDKIQRIPLQRWDLDLAEGLVNDPLTLSAQVRETDPC